MGVITCDREDCDGILSRFHSYEYGDLCQDCYTELVGQGIIDVKSFMESPVGDRGELKKQRALEHYESIFDEDRYPENGDRVSSW